MGSPMRRVVDALRTFRKEEARRLGVPAFVVMTDRDLLAIAEAAPKNEDALRRSGCEKRVTRRAILRVRRDA